MAITWNWNKKCGEAVFQQIINGERHEHTVNLYVGNCFLIMIYEYKEDGKDKYSLNSFFVDADHMERCLENNIYHDMIKIRINKAKCCNYKKIVTLLAEYMNDVTIEIYEEGEYTWKEYNISAQTIPDERMRELAESAISYMNDEGILKDFLEDRYVELNEKEMEYFGIYDWDLDEED